MAQVLDLNAYPYPSWFLVWNLFLWNAIVVVLWTMLWLLRNLNRDKRFTKHIAGLLVLLVSAIYPVSFGRTIYPALSAGVGGGAPRLATILVAGARQAALIVHLTQEDVYFLPMTSLPVTSASRRPLDRLVDDEAGPVRKAIVANIVAVRPRHDIEGMELLGFDQKDVVSRKW